MTTQTEKEIREISAEEITIINYLRNHPDFFDIHKDILEDINIAHTSGSAISLIERQVTALREKNHELKARLHELIEIARDNDKLSEMTHRLTLALLDTHSLDDVIRTLLNHLELEFRDEHIALVLFRSALPTLNPSFQDRRHLRIVNDLEPGLNEITATVKKGAPLCGRLRDAQFEFLFKEKSGELRSAALMPLTITSDTQAQAVGVLAVASSDPIRFQASMGTVFLSHITQIIGRVMQRYTSA